METKTIDKHTHWIELDILKGRMRGVVSMIMTTSSITTSSYDLDSDFSDALVGIGDYLATLLNDLGNTIETMRSEAIAEREA